MANGNNPVEDWDIGDFIDETNIQVDSTLNAFKDSMDIATKAESLRVADSLKNELTKNLKKIKNLKDSEELNPELFKHAPISAKYTEGDVKSRLGNEIKTLATDLIALEANTNVKEDYSRFLELKEDVLNIHKPFQVTGKKDPFMQKDILTFEGAEIEGTQMPFWAEGGFKKVPGEALYYYTSPIKLDFYGANSLDQVWPSDITDYSVDPDLENPNLRNLTKARLVMGNQDIMNIIQGDYKLDEEANLFLKEPGFLTILEEFNLVGESDWWKGTKEFFGFRSNEMKLLDAALNSKKRKGYRKEGFNFFLEPIMGLDVEYSWDPETQTTKTYDVDKPIKYEDRYGPYPVDVQMQIDFLERLSIYPPAQQQIIRETLQGMVDDIWEKGQIIEEKADILIDEYYDLAKKFPVERDPNKAVSKDIGYKNDDLKKVVGKKKYIDDSMHAYNYYTNEDFNLSETLNQISIEALNTEIDSLSDLDRTEALDKWMIEVGNEVQKQSTTPNFILDETDDISSDEQLLDAYDNYLKSTSDKKHLSFEWFKKMYELDPSVYQQGPITTTE